MKNITINEKYKFAKNDRKFRFKSFINNEVYNILDIKSNLNIIENDYLKKLKEKNLNTIVDYYTNFLISNICYFNSLIKMHGLKQRLRHSGKKNIEIEIITKFLRSKH